MSENVGLIGIGSMGSAIDSLMLKAGFTVIGYDVDQKKLDDHVTAGGEAATSPRDVVERADLVLTSLATASQFHTVMTGKDGIASATPKGQVVADTCTLGVDDKLQGRDALAEVGITLLDCPVSGVATRAREGELVLFASGDRAACDRWNPVFDVICRKYDYVGEFGNGSKFKYIANLLVIINTCGAAEAMGLAIKAGLDPAQVHELIGAGAGGSNMWDVRARHMIDASYPKPSAAYTIASKDGVIIAKFATDMAFPLPVFQAALQPYFQAIAKGLGIYDTSSLCDMFLENAGSKRKG
jgi:3-hydroxyisobutyrate dehydrogenase-like beta-hydroxyacid dehydrogenase